MKKASEIKALIAQKRTTKLQRVASRERAWWACDGDSDYCCVKIIGAGQQCLLLMIRQDLEVTQ